MTPWASRSRRGTLAWVIVAGWSTSDSTPPKLSARVKTVSTLQEAQRGPTTALELDALTIPPNPLI